MKNNYKWPTESPIISNNVMDSGINLLKEKYGALSQKEDVYSRICVGTSVFSIEPYRGCPLECAYCMANNDVRSLSIQKYQNNVKDAILRVPELLYNSTELLEALINHPAFIQDKTIIGFCTGSTEVFWKEVNDNVWLAMERMIELKLKNPIWLVAKSFMESGSAKWYRRFQKLLDNGIRVVISITDAGLPAYIEPFQPSNRFEPFKALEGSGVIFSHHLRPIIPNVSTKSSVLQSLEKSKNIVSSICIGGLRIDPAMKIFWENEEFTVEKPGSQKKYIDAKILEYVSLFSKDHNIPLFIHSSEMISYHLGIKDFNMTNLRLNNNCFLDFGNTLLKRIEQRENNSIPVMK